MVFAGETCFEAAEVETSAGKKMLVKKQKRQYQPPVNDFQDQSIKTEDSQDPQLYEADAEAKSEFEADATGIAETEIDANISVDTGSSEMLLEDGRDPIFDGQDVEKSSMMQDDSKDRSITVSKGWGEGKTGYTKKYWSNEECKESEKYSSYPKKLDSEKHPQLRDHCIYWDCQEDDAEWDPKKYKCEWKERNGKWEVACIGFCNGKAKQKPEWCDSDSKGSFAEFAKYCGMDTCKDGCNAYRYWEPCVCKKRKDEVCAKDGDDSYCTIDD